MFFNKTTKSLVIAALLNLCSAKEGISFVVVGDFGNTKNMNYANAVFDSIN